MSSEHGRRETIPASVLAGSKLAPVHEVVLHSLGGPEVSQVGFNIHARFRTLLVFLLYFIISRPQKL